MNPYRSPKEAGGKLIRKVLAQFKVAQLPYPLSGKICIAVSGGVDSVALGHLMIHYGRKILATNQISLLHIDHGWRAESATVERESVRELAAQSGIPFLTRDFQAPSGTSSNLEAAARAQRVALYEELCLNEGFAFVFTAHHRDDLAETIFWRFLRGELLENRKGVLFKDKNVLRPLLQASKRLLREYAKEEGLRFHEDPTNQNQEAFRAWYRLSIQPMLESKFPALQKTLALYATRESTESAPPELDIHLIETINRAPLNRAQRAQIDQLRSIQSVGMQVLLAGGVRLTRVNEGFLIESSRISKRNSSG